MKHYVYNAWRVCDIDGVYSIELWRVASESRKRVTCLFCMAKVR